MEGSSDARQPLMSADHSAEYQHQLVQQQQLQHLQASGMTPEQAQQALYMQQQQEQLQYAPAAAAAGGGYAPAPAPGVDGRLASDDDPAETYVPIISAEGEVPRSVTERLGQSNEPRMAENPWCAVPHFKCLTVTILALTLFIITCWCGGDSSKDEFGTETGCAAVIAIPVSFFLVLYILYVIECYTSGTRKYLKNVLEDDSVLDYTRQLQYAQPRVWMRVSCYHWETRTRTVTSTDANGHTTSRLETYSVPVTTHSEQLEYPYASWMDISPPVEGIREFNVTKLSLTKEFVFADEHSANVFATMGQELRLRNRHRDVHMSYSHGVDVDGFRSHLLAFVNPEDVPEMLSEEGFWLASLMLLSWPYRIWFERVCANKEFCVVKRLSMLPIEQQVVAPQYRPAPNLAGGAAPAPQPDRVYGEEGEGEVHGEGGLDYDPSAPPPPHYQD